MGIGCLVVRVSVFLFICLTGCLFCLVRFVSECMCVCISECLSVCLYECVDDCMSPCLMFMYLKVWVSIARYVSGYGSSCVDVYVYRCVGVYVYMCRCVCVYI